MTVKVKHIEKVMTKGQYTLVVCYVHTSESLFSISSISRGFMFSIRYGTIDDTGFPGTPALNGEIEEKFETSLNKGLDALSALIEEDAANED